MSKTKNYFEHTCSFDDFLNEKKTVQPLVESSEVAVNVPFWDEAIDAILSDLHNIAGNPIDWDALTCYLKGKYAIIGRDVFDAEMMIHSHIRELLFQHYGDTILSGSIGTGCSTAEMGAKALVISQLEGAIYKCVLQETGLMPEKDPEKQDTVASVSLDNTRCCDDGCFDERHVLGFNKYSEMLKENVYRLTCENDKKCLDDCLNELESKAGSLNIDDIMRVADREEYETLEGYISSIVDFYLREHDFELNDKKLSDNGQTGIILQHARKLFVHKVTGEIISLITKENKMK